MGRQSHKALERVKKIASMGEAEAKEYLRNEKRAGYGSLSEIPQTILKSNIAFANRMMEAWCVCEATDNLLDVSNEWKRELKRRSEA